MSYDYCVGLRFEISRSHSFAPNHDHSCAAFLLPWLFALVIEQTEAASCIHSRSAGRWKKRNHHVEEIFSVAPVHAPGAGAFHAKRVGEKARATITTRDGAKIKGYISKAGEDDFVVRDRKTDAPTTIRYTDIARVERNRGHSTARNVFLGVGIGAGALLATILIIIARAD